MPSWETFIEYTVYQRLYQLFILWNILGQEFSSPFPYEDFEGVAETFPNCLNSRNWKWETCEENPGQFGYETHAFTPNKQFLMGTGVCLLPL